MSFKAMLARSLIFLSLLYFTFTATCFAIALFLSGAAWAMSYAPAPQPGIWPLVLACAFSWAVVAGVVLLAVRLPRRIWRSSNFVAVKVLEYASLESLEGARNL